MSRTPAWLLAALLLPVLTLAAMLWAARIRRSGRQTLEIGRR